MRSLLSAGVDTTVHGLAAVLYALATHPEQWRRLREDRSWPGSHSTRRSGGQSPVQTFFRTATRDVPVGGTTIPDGEKILMFLGAANRDPRRWADPDAFDLGRDPSGHVGFGFGIHQCVGQHVARLEAECTARRHWLERVGTIEIAGPTQRHHNNTMRAWASLPMRVRPAG